jgi:outer membrane biosynthesis protein TonB
MIQNETKSGPREFFSTLEEFFQRAAGLHRRTRKKEPVKSLRTFAVLSLALSSVAFSLEPANAQATYTPEATPKTVAWSCYDAKAAPVWRVKSGDTIDEIPTASAWTSAEERKWPIVYVKHLESPDRYPPLARQTRVSGTIVIKLTIAADGIVLQTESSVGGRNIGVLRDDAERIVKTWTFGCAGRPPDAPFEHTIKFIYKLETEMTAPSLRVVMNLPDEVTLSADAAVFVQPSNTSKKGGH